MDTSAIRFEKEMVNMRRIDGKRKSDPNNEKSMRQMLYGEEGETDGNVGGLDRDGE